MDGSFQGVGVDDQLDALERRALDESEVITSPFPSLNLQLHKGGLHGGTLVVLGGRMGTRKTAVILTWVIHSLRKGLPVGLLSLDESLEMYVSKLMSVMSQRPSEWLEENWLSKPVRRIREEYAELATNLTLSRGVRPTAIQLQEWLSDAEIERAAPRILFLDYVSLLVHYHGHENERILRLFEDLQVWTHDNDLVTVALHQAGRKDEGVTKKYHGDCVTPETPILCADLVWRTAGNLHLGDSVIAFDEQLGRWPKYRTAQVTANDVLVKNCVEVFTNRGTIIVSEEHPFLVRRDHQRWVRAAALTVGDCIMFGSAPWEEEQTWESGYLAGMYDGEGSMTDQRLTSGQFEIAFSQRHGPELDRVEAMLASRGFIVGRHTKQPSPERAPLSSLVLRGGRWEQLRFLGTVAPPRFMRRDLSNLWEGTSIGTKGTGSAVIQAVIPINRAEVVGLTTSTGTFIASGFLSHNSPMTAEGLLYGGEQQADVILATYRPALNQIGNMSREQAEMILGDTFDQEKWEDARAMVRRYARSTFLQLLKNRPSTKGTNFGGVELISPNDSQFLQEHGEGVGNDAEWQGEE